MSDMPTLAARGPGSQSGATKSPSVIPAGAQRRAGTSCGSAGNPFAADHDKT